MFVLHVSEGRIAGHAERLGHQKCPPDGTRHDRRRDHRAADAPVVDGAGALLIPGFVEAHAHLDKTLWGQPWHGHQAGPMLTDRITYERRHLGAAGLSCERQATGLARQEIAMGSTHIRSHADLAPEIGVSHVKALVAVRETLEDAVTIQIVAFPQSGMLIAPGVAELIEESIALGADLVGGLDPSSIERDPVAHLDTIFAIADRHGVGLDIHLHEPDSLGAFAIELIAERTRALGLQGRVTISHAYCLGMIDAASLNHLIELLAKQKIAIMTTAPGDLPFPPVKKLRESGVVVCSGSDGVRDCWTPYGNGDMLERAMLLALRSGLAADEELEMALDVVTYGGADVMGLEAYGVAIGDRADLVLLPHETLAEAVVSRGPERQVVKGGRVVARDGVMLGLDI
jgi:cytosine/adenosine deaminase-related metal-dependent hydrolase